MSIMERDANLIRGCCVNDVEFEVSFDILRKKYIDNFWRKCHNVIVGICMLRSYAVPLEHKVNICTIGGPEWLTNSILGCGVTDVIFMKNDLNEDVVGAYVVSVFDKYFGIKHGQIGLDTDIIHDLSADSMEMTDLQLEFEKAFRTDFTVEEWSSIKYVRDVNKLVCDCVRAGRAIVPKKLGC